MKLGFIWFWNTLPRESYLRWGWIKIWMNVKSRTPSPPTHTSCSIKAFNAGYFCLFACISLCLLIFFTLWFLIGAEAGRGIWWSPRSLSHHADDRSTQGLFTDSLIDFNPFLFLTNFMLLQSSSSSFFPSYYNYQSILSINHGFLPMQFVT